MTPKREQATYWHMPEYNMEMLHARYITHRFPLHFHEEYVVGVIERGYYEFQYKRSQQRIYQGEIVLINPGEVHSGYPVDDNGWQYRTFYPSVTLMRQIASEISGKHWDFPVFNQPVLVDATLSRQLINLHRAMEQSQTRLHKDTVLREAMGLLIRRHASNGVNPLLPSQDNQAVARAQDYLQTYYADDVSLDDLARAVNLSPYHLSRMFKAHTGLPPHKYLIQVRLQRAKVLLAEGQAIADVAVAVGFADQSHLTKWFKRVIGVPPGQFMN